MEISVHQPRQLISSLLVSRSSFTLHRPENRVEIRALELTRPNEHEADRARGAVDQEGRWPCHVEGIDADRVPHAVALDHGTILIAEDGERQLCRALRHPCRDAGAPLPENHCHADVALPKLLVPSSQLTELPATVGSPHPAVKDQQQATSIPQELGE
jgi:hypothetical protein